jgi:hypothetical protein
VTIGLDLLAIGGGIVMGRWLARKFRKGRIAKGANAGAPVLAVEPSLSQFPCQLGDVVVRTAERDEAWLAGALLFEDQTPIAVLFVAPEAGSDRAIFAFESHRGLTWLAPFASEDPSSAGDPPSTIEHGGIRFERERRVAVSVTRLGSGAPSVGEHAVVAEYRAAGAERIVVVAGADRTLRWIGVALEEREYDVLPGGKSTLD